MLSTPSLAAVVVVDKHKLLLQAGQSLPHGSPPKGSGRKRCSAQQQRRTPQRRPRARASRQPDPQASAWQQRGSRRQRKGSRQAGGGAGLQSGACCTDHTQRLQGGRRLPASAERATNTLPGYSHVKGSPPAGQPTRRQEGQLRVCCS